MKVDEWGVIQEATRSELWEKYWKEEFDEKWSFETFLDILHRSGTNIIDDRQMVKEKKNKKKKRNRKII